MIFPAHWLLTCSLVFATASGGLFGNDSEPLPQSPEWQDGFRVRYTLRVVEPIDKESPRTVMAALPTGGWLRDDAADLLVMTADGTEIPFIVLSHAAEGETIIQFRRRDTDREYYVFASNPDAAGEGESLAAQVDAARDAAESATLAMMAAQREAGDWAGRLRTLRGELEALRETLTNATTEQTEWTELLPQRQQEKDDATAALAKAETAHAEAVEAHSEPGEKAARLSAAASELERAVSAAEGEVRRLESLQADGGNRLKAIVSAVGEDERQAARAQQRLDRAKSAVDGATTTVGRIEEMLKDPEIEERRRAVLEGQLEQAKQALAEAQAALSEAEASAAEATAGVAEQKQRQQETEESIQAAAKALPDARSQLEAAREEAAPANEAAREARRLAAPTAAILDAAEQALSAARERTAAARESLLEATERMEELKATIDTATGALAEIEPQWEPLEERAAKTAAAAREAAQRARTVEDAYRELALEADPRLFREGMTVEYRKWEGDTLGEWAVVFDGLNQSSTITDNAVVGGIFSFGKLFRNSTPRDFSASYRGYLKIDEPGIYSFFVNSDDTAFLFINGYLVDSRVGSNTQVRGRFPVYSLGSDMQLDAGVHTIEVHQIVGNNPRANGGLMLLWIPPSASTWAFVPESAYPRSLLAVPIAVSAADGKPLAVIRGGLDQVLRTDGVILYGVRLEATGADVGDDKELQWEFADGTVRRGRSVRHLFFAEGDTPVSLKSHPDVPPYRSIVHVVADDNPVNPHALAETVATIEAMEVTSLEVTQLNDLFHFLRLSRQSNRWLATARVARELLNRDGLDPAYRVLLYCSLMQALAHQGLESEAIALIDDAMAAAAGVRTLQARVRLAIADMYRDVMRDYRSAGQHYEQLLNEQSRLRHPIVREAAIAMGDMYMDAGDRARAAESYRLSRRLGSIGAGPERTDAVQRGALLRLAEQQLREGDPLQTMRMLNRIERDFPEEKLDGLYRFLRGEADRVGGNYEAAILNYEAVIASPQWVGFRAAAMRGIADSYYRMGEFSKALEWLEVIEQNHAEFWQEMELAEFAGQVRARKDGDAAAGGLFERRICTYDDEGELPDRLANQPAVSKGFASQPSYVIFNNQHATPPRIRIDNLPPQGYLWVEFWYRTRLGTAHPQDRSRSVRALLFGQDGRLALEENAYLPQTFGNWRKMGFLMPLPPGESASVEFRFRAEAEILEIDAVDIRHVSDQLNNQLRRFLDGSSPQ